MKYEWEQMCVIPLSHWGCFLLQQNPATPTNTNTQSAQLRSRWIKLRHKANFKKKKKGFRWTIFHNQGFPGGSAGKEYAYSAGDLGSIPGLGRSPGEGNGYPLQYSDLESSMECIVHGVTKSQTQLSGFHFSYLTGFLVISKVGKWKYHELKSMEAKFTGSLTQKHLGRNQFWTGWTNHSWGTPDHCLKLCEKHSHSQSSGPEEVRGNQIHSESCPTQLRQLS